MPAGPPLGKRRRRNRGNNETEQIGSPKLKEVLPVQEKKSQAKQPRKEEPTMQKPEFGVEKAGLEYVSFMRDSFRTLMDGVTLMQNQGETLLGMVLKQGDAGYEEGRSEERRV